MKQHTIGIVSISDIMTSGIMSIMSEQRDGRISLIRINKSDLARDLIKYHPSMLLVDPLIFSTDDINLVKEVSPKRIKLVALYTATLPPEVARLYDHVISIYDNATAIVQILYKNLNDKGESEDTKVLSQREKEVVVGIVKGLSNKEIATEMSVSVNTIMTHRRNISAKLQIHSPAGLTIYAIVSDLVKLDEIKSQLPL
ncbi:MAG: response regulator transcription factor [Muribaculaceae bacterium]|nr:response regulator transcription factor [Muribaculaceae bacterium]